MKACLIQKRQAKTPAHNIRDALDCLHRAVQTGAGLVAFQEWFLGTNPPDQIPNKFTNMIADVARQSQTIVVTGNMRIQLDQAGRQFIQVTCVFDGHGNLVLSQYKNRLYKGERAWYREGDETLAGTVDGIPIVATSGIDSVDPDIYDRVCALAPKIWVAQANEHVYDAHTSDYERVIELMKERSSQLNCAILVPMMLGHFYGAQYTGRSFAVARGELLDSASAEPELLVVDIDVG